MSEEAQIETDAIDDLKQLKHLLRLIEAEDEDPKMLMILACICRLSAIDKREYRRQVFDQEEEKKEETLKLVYKKIENEITVHLYNEGRREGEIAKIIDADIFAVIRRVEKAKREGKISE
jgi:hypothetical protein